jgi:ketosteroid isomerase-like protein
MGNRRKKLCAVVFCQACIWILGMSVEAQQAAQPATKANTPPPEFREMQQVENRWADAVTKRDQYGLELVLAPQFIGISATGDVTTRNQQIANLFVKGSGPASLEQKVISVRLVGDVAIVNGTYVMSWKAEKGPVLEKGIFSHVYEHVHNNWLCLNSQRTVVAEDTKRAAQEKPKSSKKSDAALPMHIPLVYKGPDSTQPPPKPGADAPPQ